MKFDKALGTYDNYASVQKKVANKLSHFFNEQESFTSVLEVGSGTGIFTRELVNRITYNSLTVNDLFDTSSFYNDFSNCIFSQGDMDTMNFSNYSLITSSSAFQWSKDLENLLKKLVSASDTLVFSIYTKGNLFEIENHFGVSLEYHSTEEIVKILEKYYSRISFLTEKIVLKFNSPLEALKHLKYTGVTGISNSSSVQKIRSFKSSELTYRVSYFRCEKNK